MSLLISPQHGTHKYLKPPAPTASSSPAQPIWLKFDDEKVSEHTEEEVKLTAGGADGPIAYVCLYGRSSAVAEGISEQHQGGHGSRTADVY